MTPTGHPLVASAEDFARLMGRMGIGNDTTVVSYDAGGGTRATRLWWALKLLRTHQGQGAQRRLEEVARRGPTHVDGRAEAAGGRLCLHGDSRTWSA